MIFRIHYGLWYGALVGIIPFMFNYAAHYADATATHHGILYTILPFVALIAKPLFCSIADKYAVHHHVLVFFIVATLLGFGSLAIYPFFPDLINNHKNLVWVLYCLSAFVGNTSMCVVNSIGDTLAMSSCSRKNISYGQYRLWGPAGFGILGAIWGIANEIPGLPQYTPGIITMTLILTINTVLLATWYDKDEFKLHNSPNANSVQFKQQAAPTTSYHSINVSSNDARFGGDETGDASRQSATRLPKRSKFSYISKLCRRHSSIFVYILLFTFCGIMTSIHWQFFFRFLNEQSVQKGQSFSTVTTLALPVQSLGGELVFFLLSNAIMKTLGPSFTITVCLFSFAARYLAYAYLVPNVNIYWILFIELLQGPAFGLMYSVLTYQGKYYADCIDKIIAQSSLSSYGEEAIQHSLHATLQGVLGAAFEGLGLGLGALIGGLAYDASPLLMWKIAGFSSLVVSIFFLIITLFRWHSKRKFITHNEQEEQSQEQKRQ